MANESREVRYSLKLIAQLVGGVLFGTLLGYGSAIVVLALVTEFVTGPKSILEAVEAVLPQLLAFIWSAVLVLIIYRKNTG